MMKYTLIAAAVALGAASMPASAQWGGLGDSGWGWKPHVCQLCLTAAEITLDGGKGSTDDAGSRDFDGNFSEAKQDATFYGGGFRLGFGPRLFLDADYHKIETDGGNDSFGLDRSFSLIHYGAGVFVYSDPGKAGIYLRGGGISLEEDGSYKLKASADEAVTDENGATRHYKAKSTNGLGASAGAFFTRGPLRFELKGGHYGDITEGDVSFTLSFNDHLGFYVHSLWLSAKNREVGTVTAGNTPDEVRTSTYEPLDKEAMWLYGGGFVIRF